MHVLPVRLPGADDTLRKLRRACIRLLLLCGQPDRLAAGPLSAAPPEIAPVRNWDRHAGWLAHCRLAIESLVAFILSFISTNTSKHETPNHQNPHNTNNADAGRGSSSVQSEVRSGVGFYAGILPNIQSVTVRLAVWLVMLYTVHSTQRAAGSGSLLMMIDDANFCNNQDLDTHNAASGVEVMSAASTDGTDSESDCVRDRRP